MAKSNIDRFAMLGRFISYQELVELGDWPLSNCLKSVSSIECQNYIFISHRWLSEKHPDPNNIKYQKMVQYFQKLNELKKFIEPIRGCEISRETQIELINKRFGEIPIAFSRHSNEVGSRRFGTRWEAEAAISNNYLQSSTEFLNWLHESIVTVIDAYLWIDTFSTPMSDHRKSCNYCHEIYHDTLKSIPRLVAKGSCFYLSSNIHDEMHRGWILLEASIAHYRNNFTHDSGSSLAINSQELVRGAIQSGAYRCTNPDDKEMIARLYGINLSVSILYNFQQRDIYKNSLQNNKVEKIEEYLAKIMIDNRGGSYREEVIEIVKLFQNRRFIELIKETIPLASHQGMFFIFSMTYCIFSLTLSHIRVVEEIEIKHNFDMSWLQSILAVLFSYVHDNDALLADKIIILYIFRLADYPQWVPTVYLCEGIDISHDPDLYALHDSDHSKIQELYAQWEDGETVQLMLTNKGTLSEYL